MSGKAAGFWALGSNINLGNMNLKRQQKPSHRNWHPVIGLWLWRRTGNENWSGVGCETKARDPIVAKTCFWVTEQSPVKPAVGVIPNRFPE